MVKHFLIIHGSFGSIDGNWFPWLKKQLKELGYKVILPQFPVGENKQSLKSWIKTIEDLNIPFDNDLIIVAHSIGPAFALNLLENHKALACFFVSGFSEFYKLDPTYDKVNKTFVNRKFDWRRIEQNCKHFFIYHGDNDPYVPLKYAKNLKQKLNAKLTIIPKGKHLNDENGLTEFPLLLKDIKKFIKTQHS